MKTKITPIILTALVVSMIFSATPSIMADSKLDSLVNIVTQARAQVKLQLDKTNNIPSDIKALYEQGNSETELLISSVKQQDVEQARWHFLSAMKIFKQISMTFLESTQTAATSKTVTPQAAITSQATQAPPTSDIDYKTSINRLENYVNTLKILVAKNNISIDFTKIDELIQDAKVDITKGDMTSIEKTFADLKTTITDLQNLIKEKANQKSADRAKSFANEYINKIDTLINHAKELGISDDDVTKLKQVKDALSTTNDPSQIVVKVKRIITINIEMQDSRNQKVLPETNKQTVQTDSLKTEKTTSGDQNIKQEQKQKETKPQKPLSSIGKLEARLAKLEPNVDDGIQAKFDGAKSILTKLKNQALNGNVDQKTLKLLDSLIGEIEDYVNSQDTIDNSSDDTQDIPADLGKADTSNQQDSSKSNLKQKRSSGQKDQ